MCCVFCNRPLPVALELCPNRVQLFKCRHSILYACSVPYHTISCFLCILFQASNWKHITKAASSDSSHTKCIVSASFLLYLEDPTPARILQSWSYFEGKLLLSSYEIITLKIVSSVSGIWKFFALTKKLPVPQNTILDTLYLNHIVPTL